MLAPFITVVARMRRFIHFPLLLSAMTEVAAQTSAPVAVPALGGSLWQLFLGLGLVLALMVGSLWLLKKLFLPRGERAGLLRVVAGTAVGTRERVVIVEVGSTWLVLGVAPGRVSALAEVPRQAYTAPASGAETADGLPDWLRKLMQRK
jgi:flagellar protein FliO/FliZ